VQEIATKARHRLHSRYVRLLGRGKSKQQVVTAVARGTENPRGLLCDRPMMVGFASFVVESHFDLCSEYLKRKIVIDRLLHIRRLLILPEGQGRLSMGQLTRCRCRAIVTLNMGEDACCRRIWGVRNLFQHSPGFLLVLGCYELKREPLGSAFLGIK